MNRWLLHYKLGRFTRLLLTCKHMIDFSKDIDHSSGAGHKSGSCSHAASVTSCYLLSNTSAISMYLPLHVHCHQPFGLFLCFASFTFQMLWSLSSSAKVCIIIRRQPVYSPWSQIIYCIYVCTCLNLRPVVSSPRQSTSDLHSCWSIGAVSVTWIYPGLTLLSTSG